MPKIGQAIRGRVLHIQRKAMGIKGRVPVLREKLPDIRARVPDMRRKAPVIKERVLEMDLEIKVRSVKETSPVEGFCFMSLPTFDHPFEKKRL